jgi:hypothetical protein
VLTAASVIGTTFYPDAVVHLLARDQDGIEPDTWPTSNLLAGWLDDAWCADPAPTFLVTRRWPSPTCSCATRPTPP